MMIKITAKEVTMQDKNNVPFMSRRDVVICVALACINILLCGILVRFTHMHYAMLIPVTILIYLLEVALLSNARARRQTSVPTYGIDAMLKERGSIFFKNTKQPVAMFNDEGTLLWCNEAMIDVIGVEDNPVGKRFSSLFGDSVSTEDFGRDKIERGGKSYEAESFVADSADGSPIYIMRLTDVTELRQAEQRYHDSKVCVAYIAIDNVEDVLQYVHEKFRDAVSSVDEKLKSWADMLGASIKSYDNDKYIMFLDAVALEECLENRFAILDEIRDTRVGDGVSITVSIGVCNSDGPLKNREIGARDAIDLALQRGGDQVVYINNGATEYYGGRTKSVYKRSNVRSRTFTNQLLALMARSDNVIVMGHRYGDFDSFGASIGIARIAMLCGVKVNIAIDLRDKNLHPCIRLMQQSDVYAQVFVDSADGLDLVGPDTLLVLVDHNSASRAQFADIAARVKNIAIVDHHRKVDVFPDGVKLHYIEPSASSCCELVAEMLESAVSSQSLIKSEADMLLAGILLDTKQFTRNTGTRTFGSAQYLRGAGANPTDVYTFFKTSADDLRKESRFHTSITTYRGNIAISSCDGDTDESYRIIASKAADKMLTLRGIDAAFALVRIGDQIHISGRSNGEVNVQLILEKLNGGGHFDVAGAQVVSDSVMSVLEDLKESIDDYIDQKKI